MRRVLLLPLLVVAALAVAALALVAATSRSATADLEGRIREVRRASALAFRLAHLTAQEEREVLALRLGPSPQRIERLASADVEMAAIAAELGKSDLSPRGRALRHEVLAARDSRTRERQALVRAVEAGEAGDVERAYVRWDLLTGRTSALVADLSVFNLRRLERAIAEIDRVRTRSVALLVAVLAASAGVVLAFSLILDRFLVRPLRAMTDAAGRIADDRTALPVPGGDRQDELGVLARAMTRTAGGLVRANEELARSVSARDEFLSIVSHELKTPLTALKLQLQNGLRRWIAERGGGPEPAWASAALRQLDRVEALVAELLDLARIRTGRLTVRPVAVDLADLSRGVAERIGDVLVRAHNTLELALPDRLEVACDPERIEQVLANLLANVAQHAPGTRVVLRAARAGDVAILSVEDDGPGIPEDARERVFAPYEKVERERAGTGLGLGLHIARQIVEAHEGRIFAAVGPRGGARIVVELPVGAAPQAAALAARAP